MSNPHGSSSVQSVTSDTSPHMALEIKSETSRQVAQENQNQNYESETYKSKCFLFTSCKHAITQSPKQSDTWVFEYYWEKFYIIVCSICILICKDYIENLVMSRILQIEWLIITILQILSYKMICQHLNTTKKVIEENIYLLYNWCDIIHIYYMSIFVNLLVVK